MNFSTTVANPADEVSSTQDISNTSPFMPTQLAKTKIPKIKIPKTKIPKKVPAVSTNNRYNIPALYQESDMPKSDRGEQISELPSMQLDDILHTINDDKRMHKQQVKWYRYKIIDQWLLEQMSDLFNFFTYKDNEVFLRETLPPETDINEPVIIQPHLLKKYIKLLEKNYITEKFIYKILKKIVKYTNIKWVELHKNEELVRNTIHHKLQRHLANSIRNQ
jgi:hypothetical protein